MDKTIYQHSSSYAQEHGELDAYFTSNRASMDCTEAIQTVISDHYHNNSFDSRGALKQVLEQFSLDRVQQVFAVTLQGMEHDGHINRSNFQWANTVPIVPDVHLGRNLNHDFAIYKTHAVLLNAFAETVRDKALIRSKPPMYKAPASYARENGEIEQFRASRRVNICCAREIDDAIQTK